MLTATCVCMCVCMYVCVCEREREKESEEKKERERESVFQIVSSRMFAESFGANTNIIRKAHTYLVYTYINVLFFSLYTYT